jgi:hypothetical protein
MKSSIYWDITRCSPVKVNRRFGEVYRLYLAVLLMLVSCLAYSLTLKMEAVRSSVTSTRLYGVTYKMTVFFIATAVRTSNSIQIFAS